MNNCPKDSDNERLLRRGALRHQIKLPAAIIMRTINGNKNGQANYLVLEGQTFDLSTSGLALVISAGNLLHIKKPGEDLMLRILLTLPSSELIELEARLVRCRRQENGTQEKFLIGVQITKINPNAQIILREFIGQYEAAESF